jgi:hypothetical protein
MAQTHPRDRRARNLVLLRIVLAIFAACALACGSGNSSHESSDASTSDGAFDAPAADVPEPPGDGGPPEDATTDSGSSSGGACPPIDAGVGDASGVSVMVGPGAGAATQMIGLGGSSGMGRAFDGIGAVSGGGGSTRLLIDYPEPTRSQILDALFKPGSGAALQMLKVEIGGDVSSVDGAEPSHLHTSTDLSCNRGYQWWLMEQAKARNPSIVLYGLAWGAPGFVGGGNYWSQGMIDYLLAWLTCAKNNGLTIDYLGGWNENGYDKTWFENLHSSLATHGIATKVVGADDVTWTVADDMTSDPAFGGAVDVVGIHNPCSRGGGSPPVLGCPSTAHAVGLAKPLWATANGPLDSVAGASDDGRGHQPRVHRRQAHRVLRLAARLGGRPGRPFPHCGAAPRESAVVRRV